MAREKYTNAVATTLNGGITSSTTSVTLTDASTWPAGNFRVIVDSEIMYCTSRSSNVLTVVRGQEGTTAASHADLTAAVHGLTAGFLNQYRLDLLAAAAIIDGADSLSADDDDFDDESFSGSWTVVQGTPNATITERNHTASLLIPGGTATQQQYAFMKNKTPSANDWIQCGIRMGGGSGGFPIPGLIMADGATYNSGKQIHFGYSINERQTFLRGFAGYNAAQSGDVGGGSQFPYFWPILHMRMLWVSADHYTCLTSPDGVSWATVFSNTSHGVLCEATPRWVGLGGTAWVAANPPV